MILKIEVLRGFVAVARHGNLHDAAAKLGRTPSAVSMMLKQFEAHLGDQLFETDRKNKLTALGTFVLEQAERELEHFDGTVKAIEGYARANFGRIRVATVPSVAETIIPRLFSAKIDKYNNVHVELRDMDSRSVVHELSRGRVDIGIATLDQSGSGLYSQVLMADRFGVVCARSHPLAARSSPIRWKDLEGVRLFANSLSERIEIEAARQLHQASNISAHNVSSIMGMVRANIGVTILPEMAAKAADPSDLIFQPLADETATREIHLLRRAHSALSPAARMFEADVIQTVEEMREQGEQ